ncbi:hypothetical protein STEG23_003561, partial [Scotinomys teguina]
NSLKWKVTGHPPIDKCVLACFFVKNQVSIVMWTLDLRLQSDSIDQCVCLPRIP